ncbi:SGNH hydrolase [Lindgomyces ingoldianus]|uniref:SGNH hydrolase n=1 Tax=Lindgomyces ingoldianus TaxID=673940 RepID=A0ACB6QXE9_9PLEO|nr:SGNH hydrolase [Lindgomyces ingoldianus]KAF2471688.1 SGNH hydrolase [Lindgomyces ingoldianus]
MRFKIDGLVATITVFSLPYFIGSGLASTSNEFNLPQGIRGGSTNGLFNFASDLHRRQSTDPEWLRIMPLGASIVAGVASSPSDGFRKPLRDHLRSIGYKVNMVGSQFNMDGSMRDGDHEGHPGHRIDQIVNDIDLSNDTKPNLYLINAGTNDCQQNYLEMRGTINRLRGLVEKAWDMSTRATIILSTLLPSDNEDQVPGANERVSQLNIEIRELASFLNRTGSRIELAEMNDGFITNADLSCDGIHPTNAGYRKMAVVWNAAIAKAQAAHFLQDPEDNGIPDARIAITAPR